MAFSLSKIVSRFSRKSISFATNDSKTICALADKTHFGLRHEPNHVRSLVTTSSRINGILGIDNLASKTIKNGYSSLHTEGDRRFAELLQDEISEEKNRSVPLPKMSDGWKVSFKGAEGSLSKSHEGDTIEVSFTLNGSVPPVSDEVEEEPNMVSYPDFNIKVTKSGNPKTVEFECYFPDDVQSEMADESMSMFSIRNVVIYEGEISDETYIIDTENLDENVYSYFLSFLADRSVDQQFAEEFIELATAAEQQEYIISLQNLRDFISNK
ncbi:complement component 1 Q subcomponent-binding protein, mitochondrial-like [Styela clava]